MSINIQDLLNQIKEYNNHEEIVNTQLYIADKEHNKQRLLNMYSNYVIHFFEFKYSITLSDEYKYSILDSTRLNFAYIDEYFQNLINIRDNNEQMRIKRQEKFESDMEKKIDLLISNPNTFKCFLNGEIIQKYPLEQQLQQQLPQPINLNVLDDNDFNDFVPLKDYCPIFANSIINIVPPNIEIPRKFAKVISELSNYHFESYLHSLHEYRSKTGYPLEKAIKKYIPNNLLQQLSINEKDRYSKLMYTIN